MMVKKVISQSKDGNRMEVIAKEDKAQRTLHIRQEDKTWRYFAGCDNKDNKIYLPIIV